MVPNFNLSLNMAVALLDLIILVPLTTLIVCATRVDPSRF